MHARLLRLFVTRGLQHRTETEANVHGCIYITERVYLHHYMAQCTLLARHAEATQNAGSPSALVKYVCYKETKWWE